MTTRHIIQIIAATIGTATAWLAIPIASQSGQYWLAVALVTLTLAGASWLAALLFGE